MEKKIEQYLPLYLGQKVQVKLYGRPLIGQLVGLNPDKYFIHLSGNATWNGRFIEEHSEIKLILRPLSSMTEEEKKQGNVWSCNPEKYPSHPTGFYTPMEFQYLLSKGFDIFNLEASGLAIYEMNDKCWDSEQIEPELWSQLSQIAVKHSIDGMDTVAFEDEAKENFTIQRKKQ